MYAIAISRTKFSPSTLPILLRSLSNGSNMVKESQENVAGSSSMVCAVAISCLFFAGIHQFNTLTTTGIVNDKQAVWSCYRLQTIEYVIQSTRAFHALFRPLQFNEL